MTQDDRKPPRQPAGSGAPDSRTERRAAALRENLRRRKAQARGRARREEAEDAQAASPEAGDVPPTGAPGI